MLSATLRRLLGDRRGVSAVEFALVLPITLLFSLGTYEVARFTLLSMKLNHAATSVADLATRDRDLTTAALDGLFAAVDHIIAPFDTGADTMVIVSGVGAESGSGPQVWWQRRGAGSLATVSRLGNAGAAATLPGTLTVADGEVMVVAEVFFRYEPYLLGIVPATTLYRSAYFRPRLGTLRTLS